MEYNIQLNMRLDAGALQALLRTLDQGPHGLMRGIIDTIATQMRAQEDAAAQPQPVPPPEVAPEQQQP